MSDATARLALPMIVPGQAQKEMTHNEALVRIDAAVQASVAGFALSVPPADPAPGVSYIVGAAPTGAWTGHADSLATWTNAGWRFVAPMPGFSVWVADTGVEARFTAGGWVTGTLSGDRLVLAGREVLGAPTAAIADPAGGTVIDSQARASIGDILTLLRHHNLMEAD